MWLGQVRIFLKIFRSKSFLIIRIYPYLYIITWNNLGLNRTMLKSFGKVDVNVMAF